jgi:O-antigen biosynthesis protein WbqP
MLEDGHPPFFSQKRIGLNQKNFLLYKFRSMSINAPSNVPTDLLFDLNIYLTFIGKFLRKFHIDELPNFINIAKGEMVFVGPRPALYNQYDLIELRENLGINKLKPGITGWAQINGRDEISVAQKVQLEQEYLYKKSFLFDIEILIKTFTNVLFSKGVSH